MIFIAPLLILVPYMYKSLNLGKDMYFSFFGTDLRLPDSVFEHRISACGPRSSEDDVLEREMHGCCRERCTERDSTWGKKKEGG